MYVILKSNIILINIDQKYKKFFALSKIYVNSLI